MSDDFYIFDEKLVCVLTNQQVYHIMSNDWLPGPFKEMKLFNVDLV